MQNNEDNYFKELTPDLRRMYLKQRQSLPLSVKTSLSLRRIREWYEAHDGKVYVAFSGGKDSTVLLHLVRSIYPDVVAVFSDTGLEYPEIREFVATVSNVVWVKPTKSFKQVIEQYGYPLIGKSQAMSIRKCRTQNLSVAYRNKLMHGDEKGKAGMISDKWKKLLTAPFKVSEQCCDHLKKKPIRKYEKISGFVGFTAEMAFESRLREKEYISTGCNAFNSKHPKSKPMAFWLDEDVWQYLSDHNVGYSSIYDKGEKRTGCIFCAFGAHLEEEPNRFQRLSVLHPNLHSYCMDNLGMGEVLDFVGIAH